MMFLNKILDSKIYQVYIRIFGINLAAAIMGFGIVNDKPFKMLMALVAQYLVLYMSIILGALLMMAISNNWIFFIVTILMFATAFGLTYYFNKYITKKLNLE
ncbi:hypothetical protein PZN54_11250 [Staphylococcus capitis]|uniref:hypothetical protein n=1 Tax=Staphylococcus capitis TaxID=29388 RepID=UPI00247FFB75|nr:hypothetical protein [Staphylococcus capitis]MDH9600711.1 hypothetical protein [Staphylococcus capitis]MDH9624375.1 hypothetical protein [Staphylococcus capitis]